MHKRMETIIAALKQCLVQGGQTHCVYTMACESDEQSAVQEPELFVQVRRTAADIVKTS